MLLKQFWIVNVQKQGRITVESNVATAVAGTIAAQPTATVSEPTATPRPTSTPAPTATPRPTSTPEPTATPRPTSTPEPTVTPRPTPTATPTPDVTATIAAQAKATASAQAIATANAQATIAALPKPIDIVGSNDKVTQKVTLSKGTARAFLNHTGESNFIVKMLDENGRQIDLVANEIGPYSGKVFIPVPRTGNYLFNVTAEGNWAINIQGIELLSIESPVNFPLKGKGDAALIVNIPKSGLTTFTMSHRGTSNFIVKIVDPDNGETQVLLANKIGDYKGEVAKRADSGSYPLEITADGEWTIEISQ